MRPDDELCLCFHVSLRKVRNFLRVERPRRAAQLSECFGAGTGCGWCRPFLSRLFEQSQASGGQSQTSGGDSELPEAAAYARERGDYVREGKGTPPAGATPIEAPAIEAPSIEAPPAEEN